MPETEITDARIAEIEAGLAGVTPGPWMVQDSNSWRRIGQRYDGQDGGVLCPINQNDGHPDLCAGRGQDTYTNLRHIARCDPDTIGALIARLRRTQAELAEAREALNEVSDEMADAALVRSRQKDLDLLTNTAAMREIIKAALNAKSPPAGDG